MKKCPASLISRKYKSKPHWVITSCLQEGFIKMTRNNKCWCGCREKEALVYCCKCVCSVTQSCLTLCGPMDCNPPGSSVHGISRQEYWSELPCPTQGSNLCPLNLLHWQADSLPLNHLGSPSFLLRRREILNSSHPILTKGETKNTLNLPSRGIGILKDWNQIIECVPLPLTSTPHY